ncbi:MAG TPA: hypothetical protein VM686_07565 [Polyangiaceae bacterium]|nr:hypothetical protein [Polyangiaceae bacterium]
MRPRAYPRSTVRDLLEGAGGAALIAANLVTPFLRRPRAHWGLDEASAARSLPGDDLVARPLWSYSHGVEIDAPASAVWPWVAQLGANRAGFYSYQWLENLLGCSLTNADSVHPEWQIGEGDSLSLHPKLPPLRVARCEKGRFFVALAPADELARAEGRPWTSASWLFLVEALCDRRCRLISRYRAACSSDFPTRLAFGPTLLEAISFAMDRRMLLGVKERAERQAACA